MTSALSRSRSSSERVTRSFRESTFPDGWPFPLARPFPLVCPFPYGSWNGPPCLATVMSSGGPPSGGQDTLWLCAQRAFRAAKREGRFPSPDIAALPLHHSISAMWHWGDKENRGHQIARRRRHRYTDRSPRVGPAFRPPGRHKLRKALPPFLTVAPARHTPGAGTKQLNSKAEL